MVRKKKIPDSEFYRHFRGSFSGILRWADLDTFWDVLRNDADGGWYIYQPGETVPNSPVNAQQLHRFIEEMDKLLRREHDESYCGVVYVDDRSNPEFVKIYDPNNLGVVCGFSDNPPLPGWIVSKLAPEELDQQVFASQSRKRWWARLFS